MLLLLLRRACCSWLLQDDDRLLLVVLVAWSAGMAAPGVLQDTAAALRTGAAMQADTTRCAPLRVVTRMLLCVCGVCVGEGVDGVYSLRRAANGQVGSQLQGVLRYCDS